ncbi:peptidase inhibitor family I36 protein [Kitasatospora griseola]|uniref:peptidase inhibitor family I36 protein n=1 Tax=Kitasatospora griseola TaxID=2064 RepID=UPI003819C95E
MKLHRLTRLTRRIESFAAALVLAAGAFTGASPAHAANSCEDAMLCLSQDYDGTGQVVSTEISMGQCVPGYVQWPDGSYANPLSVEDQASFGVWVYNSSDCSGDPNYVVHAHGLTNLRPASWSFRSSVCPQDKVCFFGDGDLVGETAVKNPGSSCDNATSHGSYSLINNSSRAIRIYNSVWCTGAYAIADVPSGGTFTNSSDKITGWKNI